MIYTGNYDNCKSGNLISISGDRGKKKEFKGKVCSSLAPLKSFWEKWEANIGKIDEYENIKYYIREYYKQVLIYIDIEKIIRDEEEPIFLCYEDSNEFCHRHVLAEYIELKYGIKVMEIEIDENENITPKERPEYIKKILFDVIKEEKLEELPEHWCSNCEYKITDDLIDDIISENHEYREMDYDEAVKKIGHCELRDDEDVKKHGLYCEYYYPDEVCLRKCKVMKKH